MQHIGSGGLASNLASTNPHIFSFSTIDYTAIVVGLLCGLWAWLQADEGENRDAAILAGYAAGQSIVYLVALCWTMIFRQDLYDTVSHANPGTMFIAFLYAAIINIKSLPWIKR